MRAISCLLLALFCFGCEYFFAENESRWHEDGDADRDAEEDEAPWSWIAFGGGNFCYNLGGDTCETTVVYAFEIMDSEVTQAQYEAVTGKTPSFRQGCGVCPVENVTWEEARSFCEFEAVGGRLPTETEWEFATRTGLADGDDFCFNVPDDLDEIAYFAENSAVDEDSKNATQPVKRKNPDQNGLFDILGNVAEWCQDVWCNTVEEKPLNSCEWGHTEEDCLSEPVMHVYRGGHYDSPRGNLAPCARQQNTGASKYVGFRCARDAPGTQEFCHESDADAAEK